MDQNTSLANFPLCPSSCEFPALILLNCIAGRSPRKPNHPPVSCASSPPNSSPCSYIRNRQTPHSRHRHHLPHNLLPDVKAFLSLRRMSSLCSVVRPRYNNAVWFLSRGRTSPGWSKNSTRDSVTLLPFPRINRNKASCRQPRESEESGKRTTKLSP